MNQLVQRGHHLGTGYLGVCLGFQGKLGRKALVSHLGQLSPGTAGDDKTAGFQGVTLLLHHRIGLAGDEGLVHLELSHPDNAVGADLISRAIFYDVIPHQGVGGHQELLPSPDGGELLLGNEGQLVHRPLCPDFLEAADDHVHHHNDQEGHVLDGGTGNGQNDCQNHEYQVKKGEKIPFQNLLFRQTHPGGLGIPQPRRQTLLYLGLGQTLVIVRGYRFYLFCHGYASPKKSVGKPAFLS